MHKDFESLMISAEQIQARINELAAELDREYKDKNPLFVCILKGSMFFFSDLLKALTIPAEIDFISVSSYGAGVKKSSLAPLKNDPSFLFCIPTTWIHRFPGA